MASKVYSDYDFLKLADKKKNQAFLLSLKIPFPLGFARHYFIVTNEKGILTRYDVMEFKNKKKKFGFIHVRHNELVKPFNRYIWKALPKRKYVFVEDSIEDTKAKKLIGFLEGIENKYPFKDEYGFSKVPNSNTFISWILDKNKYLNWKLGLRAVGKNYKKLISNPIK